VQLAANTAERNSGTRTRQPSLLAGMLFDGDGNRMTPTHATKKGTRYRYYVSRPLITDDKTDGSAALRIPAGEIEQAVTSRMRQWLIDPASVYQAIRPVDPSAERRLIARAEEIRKSWSGLPATRQRALLTAQIERIDVGAQSTVRARSSSSMRPNGSGRFAKISERRIANYRKKTSVAFAKRTLRSSRLSSRKFSRTKPSVIGRLRWSARFALSANSLLS
jgi:hypothetical protein